MNEQRTVNFPNLKFPKQVKGGKVIFTQDEFANFAGQILNAIRFMRLIVPTTDGANNLNTTEAQIEWAEEGVIITLPPQFNIQTPISGGGGGGGTTGEQYTITAVNQNTLSCNDPNGNPVTIQKPQELFGSNSGENIYGNNVTYTNYGNNYNTRTVTDASGNSGAQYITPEYVVGEIISAQTITTATGSILEEFSPSRQWGEVD